MIAGLLTIVSIILIALALYSAKRLISNFDVVRSGVRLLAGVMALAFALLVLLFNIDFLSHKPISLEKAVATVSFERISDQHFKVTLVDVDTAEENVFELNGDLWGLDMRLYKLQGFFALFGAKNVYKLESIKGRYFSLEQERNSENSSSSLANFPVWLDFWGWINQNQQYIPGIRAEYGSVTFLPMADGAIFQVSLASEGLIALPFNDAASLAVNKYL